MPRKPGGGYQTVPGQEAVNCLPRPFCQPLQVRQPPMTSIPEIKQSPHSISILQISRCLISPHHIQDGFQGDWFRHQGLHFQINSMPTGAHSEENAPSIGTCHAAVINSTAVRTALRLDRIAWRMSLRYAGLSKFIASRKMLQIDLPAGTWPGCWHYRPCSAMMDILD